MITIKRIYEPALPADGYRVLIDRLWPRGVTKEAAALQEWLRDIAPSVELREWFGHMPERFAEFDRRYRLELGGPECAGHVDRLRRIARKQTLTLLFGARDERHNGAVVLAALLDPRPRAHAAATG